jgi:dTDP-glucose 4,6-dehydratase
MYIPKNVLVTGGAGFIGSHVVDRLVKLGYNVVVLDKFDVCSSKHRAGVENVHTVRGDIRDMKVVSDILRDHKIDTVMHFAAATHVDNSFGNSLEFTINNVYGTHALLEACRIYGKIRRFINVSTDEVYGTKEGCSDENSTLEPTNPYSAAKAGAEMMCKAYATSYDMPIIISRGNNVYGPGQYPEKLVPKMLLLSLCSPPRDLPVHGDGSALRSFLYISDVVEAFDLILHYGLIGETYNIGTKKEMSVLDVVRSIRDTYSSKSNIVNVKDRAFNDKRYFIGFEKLSALGWSQEVDWEEGLALTAAWYSSEFADAWNKKDVEKALLAHPV